MIGIIAAMPEEMAYLHKVLIKEKQTLMGDYRFIQGQIDGNDVVLVQSGLGKVNAAVATTLLQQVFKPNIVINIGAAGGVSNDLQIGDIVLGSELVYHDADVTALGCTYGQMLNMPATYHSDKTLLALAASCDQTASHLKIKQGLIVSGDSFICDAARMDEIAKHFDHFYAVDMESCAVAQVCHRFQMPFLIIRAISDLVHAEKNEDLFAAYLRLAAKHSTNLLLSLLAHMSTIEREVA